VEAKAVAGRAKQGKVAVWPKKKVSCCNFNTIRP
jgi:hypothetical protein